MTTPAAPTTLEAAERDLAELERDLATLRDALAAHEGDLTIARRAGKAPAKLAELGTRVSSLRLLVKDQSADAQAARATVERLRAEGEHAERVAALRSTYDELASLRTKHTEALIAAIDTVVAAFEPVRAIRGEWIEARSRARSQVEALGIAVTLRFGTQEEKRPTLEALEALDLDAGVLFEAPDNAAPRVFEHFEREAHYPVPAHLVERARAVGPHGHPEHVTVRALLDVARSALTDPLREAPPS